MINSLTTKENKAANKIPESTKIAVKFTANSF